MLDSITYYLLHKQFYHGAAPCEIASDDVKELINDYKNSDDKKKKLLEKKYGRRQMKLVEETLTTDYLRVCITKYIRLNRYGN